jgi:hypothetical protein
MTIDPLLHYSGLQVDGKSMMTSIGGQQEVVIDNDDPVFQIRQIQLKFTSRSPAQGASLGLPASPSQFGSLIQ